jgi:Ca2+-binding EF-hand superfamily protein
MGCNGSKAQSTESGQKSTSISPKSKDKKRNNDRYCHCNPDSIKSQSFVCPVCKKVRLDVKKDVQKAQRKQRKSSLAPRNLRHRAPSDEIDQQQQHQRQQFSEDKNPQQAYSNSGSSNSDSSEDRYNETPKELLKKQSSLQRRSQAFWAVSHKVQQMVDITKFYEMALRKLFRDFDIDQNGFIDAPELCQLIANATGHAGIYQPLTMQEAELFLLSSIKSKKRREETNVHDIVLEENKFIKTMMKYGGHSNNLNEAEDHLFSSKSTRGSTLISAQQRMTKKINQFVALAKRRLERRSVSLYQLFHSYCGTHYINTRNEWIKDVIDINDLHHMMCDVANGRKDEEPSRTDVKLFIESMDSNGDHHLQVKEFLTYMMRGLVQSRASMIRFSERSSMHHAVCCFLMNVDARHTKDVRSKMKKRKTRETNHLTPVFFNCIFTYLIFFLYLTKPLSFFPIF